MTTRLFTIKQAAEYLGISVSLVYGLCAQKRLRHERYGLGRGKIQIPEDALEEYRRNVTVESCMSRPARLPSHPVRLKHLSL